MAEEETWDQEIDSEQSFSDEENAYIDEPRSEDEEDYGYELGMEEPEPEPPDHVQDTSIYNNLYEQEDAWEEQDYEENGPREEAWTEEDDSQRIYEEEEEEATDTDFNEDAEYDQEDSSLKEDYDVEEAEGGCEEESDQEERPWYEIPYSDHEEEYQDENGSHISLEEASFGEEPKQQEDFIEEEEVISEDGRDDSNPRYINYSGREHGPAAYLRWERDMDEWFQENQIPEEERTAIAEDTLFEEAYLEWDRDAYHRLHFGLPDLTWEEMKQFLHKEFVEEPSTEPYYTRCDIPQKPRRWIMVEPSKKSSSPKPRKKTSTISKKNFVGKPMEPAKKIPKVSKTKKSKESSTAISLQSLKEACLWTKEALQLGKVEARVAQKKSATKPQGEINVPSSCTKKPAAPCQDKSSIPLSLPQIICYRCQGMGHIAKVCPTRRLENDTSLVLNKNSFKDSDNLVETNLNIPNASILHLSLSKNVEIGLGKTSEDIDQREGKEEKEHALAISEQTRNPEIGLVPVEAAMVPSNADQSHRRKESIEEKPPDQSKNTESVRQVSLSLTSFVSHDATYVLKNLLNIQEYEETSCLKPQVEENLVVTSAKEQDSISFSYYKESMMHLFLAQSVNLNAGTKGARHSEFAPEENLLSVQVQDQRTKAPMVTTSTSTKEENVNPDKSRGVILSYLLKGEPPDVPNLTKLQAYQGKTLNSQRRMKANLLSFGTGFTVSRSKLFQEGEYDEDIKSSPVNMHREDTNNLTKTFGENQLERTKDIGVFLGAYLPNQKDLSYESTCSRNLTHQGTIQKKNSIKILPHEEDIQLTNCLTSNASDLDFMRDFALLSIKKAQPRASQGNNIYLAGNGVHNIKNLTEITSELQDNIKTSCLANKEQMEQGDDSGAKLVRTLEYLNILDFKRLQEEGFIKDFKLNGPIPAQTTLASKPAYSSPNKVSLNSNEFVQVIQHVSVVIRVARDPDSSPIKDEISLECFIFILANFPFLVF